jgi:hypothetical protein
MNLKTSSYIIVRDISRSGCVVSSSASKWAPKMAGQFSLHPHTVSKLVNGDATIGAIVAISIPFLRGSLFDGTSLESWVTVLACITRYALDRNISLFYPEHTWMYPI